MQFLHPRMSPELSRSLAALAQRLDYDEHVQLMYALHDIAIASDGHVVTSLDDPVVPDEARRFIKNLQVLVSTPNKV